MDYTVGYCRLGRNSQTFRCIQRQICNSCQSEIKWKLIKSGYCVVLNPAIQLNFDVHAFFYCFSWFSSKEISVSYIIIFTFLPMHKPNRVSVLYLWKNQVYTEW